MLSICNKFLIRQKRLRDKVVCSRYSAVGKMEDCYSDVRGSETVSGTLPIVDVKVSNQHHDACCSRARLATLIRFIILSVFGGWKLLILYIKSVSFKMRQNLCIFKGCKGLIPLEAHVLEPHWATWLGEHFERGRWPKGLKADGSEPNLGQKTVSQVHLPRG